MGTGFNDRGHTRSFIQSMRQSWGTFCTATVLLFLGAEDPRSSSPTVSLARLPSLSGPVPRSQRGLSSFLPPCPDPQPLLTIYPQTSKEPPPQAQPPEGQRPSMEGQRSVARGDGQAQNFMLWSNRGRAPGSMDQGQLGYGGPAQEDHQTWCQLIP